MNKTVLGLDLGTNSLGWAIIKQNENKKCELTKQGSIIFTEGVKNEKGNEISRSAERTKRRGARRLIFRRRLRKIELLKVLIKHQLCPPLSAEELQLWKKHKTYPLNKDFLLWQKTDEDASKNPYYYRYVCLTEKLDLTESLEERYVLGRALYHICQRRGFLSNRLDKTNNNEDNAPNDKKSDEGKVKAGISELDKELKESGCTHLGEYFYKLYAEKGNTIRIRNRYTDREKHYEKEFKAICAMQELSNDLVQELNRVLFFQRPLKSQKHNVGKCTLEPSKTRCLASHPLFEEFRMLSFINNIYIKTKDDFKLRPINGKEIEQIKPLFYRKSKPNFSFEDIVKKLAGKKSYSYAKENLPTDFVFNYRKNQSVAGCPTTAQLIKVFGDDWKHAIAETYTETKTKNGTKTLQQIIDDIHNVLVFFDKEEKLKEFGINKLQLTEEEAKSFSKIKLVNQYAMISLKAIRNILPFLKAGKGYSHAVLHAKIPQIVGNEMWNNQEKRYKLEIAIDENLKEKEKDTEGTTLTKADKIKQVLKNDFGISPILVEKLYHPSMINLFPIAQKNNDGVYQLGSPKTSSLRNPMAMRSLHVLKKASE